ncbi:MAG: VWA domain-containing protein [Pseudomonadota bacterium]
MISFAFPAAFLALPLPLLIWRFLPAHKERVPAIRFPFFRQVVDGAGAQAAAGAVVMSRNWFQMIAAAVIWIMLVLAVAQPERVGAPIETSTAARDLILGIDISGSMDTRDFTDPQGERLQRLAGVRNVVRRFIEGRDGDRMALIVFGSKAYLQSPLTEDTQAIVELLDQTQVGMAGPHTALGDSIGLAIRTFESSEIDQRLLVLLSDGSDTSSRMSPLNAAEIAHGAGVEIYTIAVGDPKAEGENRVDVATLRNIAQRTGGAYFFAEDQAALDQIYDRIDVLAPRETDTQTFRPRQSLHHIPLLSALATGIGAVAGLHLTAQRRRRRLA